MGQKGGGDLGHVTYFSNFGTISEMAEDTNLRFCTRTEVRNTKKNEK